MGLSASDVVPFTQARANLSELADQANAEKISGENGESYVVLIDDAKRGLADIEAGRIQSADAAIAHLQQQRAAAGKAPKRRV